MGRQTSVYVSGPNQPSKEVQEAKKSNGRWFTFDRRTISCQEATTRRTVCVGPCYQLVDYDAVIVGNVAVSAL